MKVVINLALSFLVLAVCVWLVWPNAHDRGQLEATLRGIQLAAFWPYLAGVIGLLTVVHLTRSLRWNNLLRPLDAGQPSWRLLKISTIGFMAILALPARVGEFARPLLLRRHTRTPFSVLLGTVAVERVIDLMMVSALVATCFFALHGPASPSWMLPTAWISVAILSIGVTVLYFGTLHPRPTARFFMALARVLPVPKRIVAAGERFMESLFAGFQVLRHGRETLRFVIWTVVYWVANGLSMWLLARGMGLPLSVIGAFATMGLVAVGIMLPNAPGLVGQFHWFTTLGLSLYLGQVIVETQGLAYAIVLHGIQVIWYVGLGVIAMLASHTHLGELVGRGGTDPAAAPTSEEPLT